MYRGANALPSYRKHKSSGQAVVTLSGRDVYLGPHGTKLSRDNYDRVVSEWLAAGRTIARADVAEIAVVELASAFHKAGMIPDSQADAFKAVLQLLVRLYGRTPAAAFGPLALRAVREQMIAAGWKRITVNQRVHHLRRVFKWGASHQLLPAGVVEALKTVEGLRAGKSAAPESIPVEPVAVEHVAATLPFMPPTVRAMVQLQTLTGMRAGEVCQMRTRDVDTSGATWVYRPASHKTQHHGKRREVPLGPRARELLQPLLRPNLDEKVFTPARAERERRDAIRAKRKTPAGYGNTTGSNRKAKPARTPGDAYDTAAYRRAIAYACDRAFPVPATLARAKGENAVAWRNRLGPEKWTELRQHRAAHRWHPHQLRHSFADQVRRQFGLDHAQKALGHAHANVTERYAQVALEKAIEVARAIG